MMSLRKYLDAGNMVMWSTKYNKLKPLEEMSLGAQKREGYVDVNGQRTDRGYDRATRVDDVAMRAAWIAGKKIDRR